MMDLLGIGPDLLFGLISLILSFFVILLVFEYLFTKKSFQTFVIDVSEGYHEFKYASRVGSEEIIVYANNKRKKAIDHLYCGVKPIPCDAKNHPDRNLRRYRNFEVYFHRKNEPFVRGFVTGRFVDPEKINKVLIERGHVNKDGTPKNISDIDFCKSDYAYALHIDAIKKCQEASDIGAGLGKTAQLFIICSCVCIFYIFMAMNGMYYFNELLSSILKFLG